MTATGGVAGLLTREALLAAPSPTPSPRVSPGTHAYHSGTQGDLQVEMGMYGAIIVLPTTSTRRCTTGVATLCQRNVAPRRTGARTISGWQHAAYDHPTTCYDREYLFQFSEMDPNIHTQAKRR